MILSNVSKTIVVSAGHYDKDPGAIFGKFKEAELTKKVRDEVVTLLPKAGFTVHWISDNLDLKESIASANKILPNLNDGLCIDIHFNISTNLQASGSEAYHGTSETSKQIAETIVASVSNVLGLPNRGAHPDTETAVGSLGWIRQTKAWATLVEVAYISSTIDMVQFESGGTGFKKAALGIVNGICDLYGVPKIGLTSIEELKKSLNASLDKAMIHIANASKELEKTYEITKLLE